MGKLDGKIALITGGTSGIGLATAKRFVLEGAFVFITGRTQSKLADAAEQIGSSVEGVRGDVSNLNDLDNLYAAISKTKGKLDIVFANAAAAQYTTFGSVTEAHFDDTTDALRMTDASHKKKAQCCGCPTGGFARNNPILER